MEDQRTTVDALVRFVGRDGVAVSATTELANATSPATRLPEAASRYADAVTTATHQLQRGVADDALETAGPGPLPWLPGIPSEIGEHRELSNYLTARSDRVTQLSEVVRHDAELPPPLHRFDVVLRSEARRVGTEGVSTGRSRGSPEQ